MKNELIADKRLKYTGTIMLFYIGFSNLYKSDLIQWISVPIIFSFVIFAVLKLKEDKRSGGSTQKAYIILIISIVAFITTIFALVDTYLMNKEL